MSNVTELINVIKSLNEKRDKLNREYYKLDTSFDFEDYANAWGCEATFDAVDTSLEQRAESLVCQLADGLALSFDEACKYYHQVILGPPDDTTKRETT